MHARTLAGTLVLAFSLTAATARAAPDPGADTPRELMADFLAATGDGRYQDATRLLDPGFPAARAETAARELRAVLDRRLWIDPQTLSHMPGGTPDDGLAPDLERVGFVPGPTGDEPVLLRRISGGESARWVIDASTLRRVDTWYGELPDHWLREHLPGWLFRAGPRDLFYWQWLALPLLLLAAWVVARILALPLRLVLRRIVKKTAVKWDDLLLELLYAPTVFALMLLLIYVALPSLSLVAPARAYLGRVLHALVLVNLFWAILRGIDMSFTQLGRSAWLRMRPQASGLMPVLSRSAKLFLIVVGVIMALQEMGYPITGLLAGLGIGGLALALATQKTFENLIGSMALSVDQPFRQGDTIRVDDLTGTVEVIGLRSTRVRTGERTVVTLPNGRLADARIENLSLRERFRLATTLQVTQDATPDQLRTLVHALDQRLREHPAVEPDGTTVKLTGIGAFSFDIALEAWFQVADSAAFAQLREDLLLSFIQIVHASGAAFAIPARTIHMRSQAA